MARDARCAEELVTPQRPRLEVADVLRTFVAEYEEKYGVTSAQRRVLRDLMACRTELLGGHLAICDKCGHEVPSYNSCGNRHCMKCQSLRQAKWVLERMQRILPVPYFHVVFTVPGELQAIARANQRVFYKLLFNASADTLLTLSRDADRLGATPGITSVLHTWRRDLGFHPHVHCIVTGGGLALDGSRWARPRYDGDFLFPVRVLSNLFRGKFLAALSRAVDEGRIDLGGGELALEREAFAQLKDALYRKKWVTYAKRPFAGPEQVLRYLGLYTHRVGISNHRLIAMDDQAVTFGTKNGERVTLHGVEFIRRFLQHVLPAGFVKVRHYGLHAPSNATRKLELARRLLDAEGHSTTPPRTPTSWTELFQELTGKDPRQCPRCKTGVLRRYVLDYSTGELVPVPFPDTS